MLRETNRSSVGDGADMFFPTIIYCLLKGCPKEVKANVDFIKLYRHPQLLDSEDDYFLTTMTSAIEFISNMIDDDLNIEKSEFKELYEKYAEEKSEEVKEKVQRRMEYKMERNYDDFENQSDVSMMTTQSNAQILGELQSLDVPIFGKSLVISKGVQTDEGNLIQDSNLLGVPEKEKSQACSSST